MASLFKNNVLQEQLALSIVPKFEDRIRIVKQWHTALTDKSLLKKTETQCEQAFNDDFFVKILGYTRFPSEKYTIEVKAAVETAGGQKPDAALGIFTPDGNVVQCVCEIKDANTSLDKPQQREGNLTPVQQGFKYKPLYKNCGFVIVTNFREIRLYRDTMHDYERFTLAELADPADNYRNFRKFHYLLSADHFIEENGKSQTEELLAAIRIEQEEITKDFYREYRTLRMSLIDNIRKNNPVLSFDTVLEKAQKVIDRIVFASFCEDVGLLPENKLAEVVAYTEKGGLDMPIWEIMKKFFVAIDKGSEKMEMPHGYNGELFKPDAVLDALTIDDEICREFVRIGRFDFREDLSANILGHIFEQSITDIEEIRQQNAPTESTQKTSKRKKDGIFYTPEYVVDFIVASTLGEYLQELERSSLREHGVKEGLRDQSYEKRALNAYLAYRERLLKLKVLDLACGSGAFLVKVFDYLRKEHERIGGILLELRGGTVLEEHEESVKIFLHENIYGVDLNAESVEITKLSLWLKTTQKGKRLEDLKNNIKCGNSLIDDSEVAGTKAFHWEKEFAEILNSGGFDIIVGNPPWGANIDKEAVWLGKHYPDSTKHAKDTYKLFIDKGLQLLKENGRFGYIVPSTFLYQPRYQDVRDIVERYRHGAVNLGEHIFEGVDLPCAILVVHKHKKDKSAIVDLTKKPRGDIPFLLSSINLENEIERGSSGDKLLKDTGLTFDDVFVLKDAGINYQAVNVGKGKKGESKLSSKLLYSGKIGNPSLDVEFWKGENFHKYSIDESTENFVRTNYEDFKEDNERVILNDKFFSIHPKILWRQTADRIIATIDERGIWFGRSVFGGVVKDEYKKSVDIYFALAVFNSAYIDCLYQRKVLETGRIFPQVKLAYIKPLPFVIPDKEAQDRIATRVRSLIGLGSSQHEKLRQVQQLLKAEYRMESIPKKLQKLWELSFDDFLKALKLRNVSLPKKQELMEYFEQQKTALSTVADQIETLQREIDEMVCDAYGLTKEERAIVLRSAT
ncbi:hypothetical protein A2454_05205 [Candidatus Peribacteria bacterium RIFOXYC2_FULL_55_14]|nr:MAG: hypothetical protein A2198_03745 [Candidatus Peribacteria bacterium RIFOXYA1_FULL_56_14]OGJ73201.1 MAG: hypothetical protein A2217_03480 [Candidatus Peribacteria bacterium RIFOXYA2_FULL_55_28]OGJ75412.1 MAG: hypothetical protein A2384_00740 [Candidatus Peribacteria bacterium RIFOXYB1_FULL_54_35]OGJ76412.1 MAG: hypothetical protein A2327_01130 [Candidatus Peribacteria bacterium RIFOXYB2_FULL_54_17]OGJ79428.1 MAG: hypothetical protein A2424_01360 [Candidatus Peribacteria bacterium RIFOXYC